MNNELITILKKLMLFRPKTITLNTIIFEYVINGDDLVFIYPYVFIYSSDCYFTGITRVVRQKRAEKQSGVLNINDIKELNFEF